MFIVTPDVNTAPAIPKWDGNRISETSPPVATLENNVCVAASNRNTVARSAPNIRVVSATARWSNLARSNSELMSETSSRKSISLIRMRSISSIYCML